MVGAKNHIFLLHLDHPSREPEKVSAGRRVALARLASSSLGTTPCPSARAWRWMCSELGCSNLTRDTFTPGCLNQWGQPIPGGAEPCWEGLAPEGQGGLARRGDLGGLQAVPGALLSHLVPAAASRAPAVSPLKSSQDILLAGCTARAQQKKISLRHCSLAFPRAGIQESLPTAWVGHGTPRLCPHTRFTLSGFGRLPPGPGDSGGCQICARATPCPRRAPEPGSACWLSLFPLVPREAEGSRGCIRGVSVFQIFWPAPREQVEHCQLAGKNVEVSRTGSPPPFSGSSPRMLNNPITLKGSLGVCLEWSCGASWSQPSSPAARAGSGQAPHPQQSPQLGPDEHLPCADGVCQLHPPPPALQPEPRVRLRHRLLPARLCLHPAGSQGEGEGHPGQTYPYGRRCQETPLPGSRQRGSP